MLLRERTSPATRRPAQRRERPAEQLRAARGFCLRCFRRRQDQPAGGAGYFYDTRITGIINNRFVDRAPSARNLSSAPAQSSREASATRCAPRLPLKPPWVAPRRPTYFPLPSPRQRTGLSLRARSIRAGTPTKYQVPTVYNWNLALENQLPWDLLMRAAYVGHAATIFRKLST